jgi:hypothetical protein
VTCVVRTASCGRPRPARARWRFRMVVRQVREAARRGAREVVLTGINLADIATRLTGVACGCLSCSRPSLTRPTWAACVLGSIEPQDVDERLADVMAASVGRVAPFLAHVPAVRLRRDAAPHGPRVRHGALRTAHGARARAGGARLVWDGPHRGVPWGDRAGVCATPRRSASGRASRICTCSATTQAPRYAARDHGRAGRRSCGGSALRAEAQELSKTMRLARHRRLWVRKTSLWCRRPAPASQVASSTRASTRRFPLTRSCPCGSHP